MLVEFLHYNRWANLKLLDVCSALTRDQLDSSAPGTYGSIYDTLMHIIRAEASYINRLTGTRPMPPFAWDEHPPLAAIRSFAEITGSGLEEAARQTQPTDYIEREWDGQTIRFKAVALLVQAVDHGIEHRTNITTILAQQGIKPPDVDGWDYIHSNLDRLGA